GGGATATAAAATGGGAGGAVSDKALVVARGLDVNSLDPSKAYCDTCQIYLSAVHQTVIGLDPFDNATLLPRIAITWTPNADFTEWTFALDPKAKFADGSPVTSEDVKWSWERLHNIKASPSYFVDNVKAIDTPDAATVIVHMNAADSSFPTVTTAPYMVITNKQLAEANGAVSGEGADQTDTAEQWFLANSAGSGPYILANYQEGSELRLTRNENFWGDLPYFKDVIIKDTKEAVAQRQLLETGEADVAMQINPDLARGISNDEVVIEEVPSFNFVYIYIWPGTPFAADVHLDDVRVRQAIRYAIDYEGMVDVTVGGSGRKQATAIPNGFQGTEGLPLPAEDLEKSKQLLADAGYPDGFTLPVYFAALNVYGVDFSTMLQKLKSDLARVNINLDLQPSDGAVLADMRSKGGYPLTASYFAPDHTDSIQYAQFFGMIPGGFFNSRLKVPVNEAEAKATDEALRTVDPAARTKLFEQIGLEMINDNYIVPLVNPNLVLASRKGITGMHYSACCNFELARLGESQ
ncbi:MAG: ABC transporter substrate-binding protein, partial [Chloroflexi bacterium]|nr:ABC transporter substrate-binding protein [Chloroflexota bacterium]